MDNEKIVKDYLKEMKQSIESRNYDGNSKGTIEDPIEYFVSQEFYEIVKPQLNEKGMIFIFEKWIKYIPR